MKVRVQSIHFDEDQKLLQFVSEKVDKLTQFFDDIVDSEVFLKIDKSDSTENKIAEIRIHTPGKTMFAKEQCKTFEEATDNAVEAVRKQMTKHKEKVKGI